MIDPKLYSDRVAEIDDLLKLNAQLRTDLATAVEALEHYANENTWSINIPFSRGGKCGYAGDPGHGTDGSITFYKNGYDIAQAALDKLKTHNP